MQSQRITFCTSVDKKIAYANLGAILIILKFDSYYTERSTWFSEEAILQCCIQGISLQLEIADGSNSSRDKLHPID